MHTLERREPTLTAVPEAGQLYTCIAFDPGGTTGWSVFAVHREAMGLPPYDVTPGQHHWVDIAQDRYRILENVVFWAAGEFFGSEDDQVDQMVDLCTAWPDNADIVVEDFILRTYRRDRTLLSPVRVTAAFEYALRWVGRKKPNFGSKGKRTVIKQQSSLAMTHATDVRLRAWGFYNPTIGKEHARDAVRHSLTYMRRVKESNVLLARRELKRLEQLAKEGDNAA